MRSTPPRAYNQPERDWLQQLRRRRVIWFSISFFVLVVTVLGLFNLLSQPEPQQLGPGEGTAFILHGRNAGGAAAQVLVSALTRQAPLSDEVSTEVSDLLPEDLENVGSFGAILESGPSDAPFLRRKTLTSAEVMTITSRYFLEGDALQALRLAWCLSRFDPPHRQYGTLSA